MLSPPVYCPLPANWLCFADRGIPMWPSRPRLGSPPGAGVLLDTSNFKLETSPIGFVLHTRLYNPLRPTASYPPPSPSKLALFRTATLVCSDAVRHSLEANWLCFTVSQATLAVASRVPPPASSLVPPDWLRFAHSVPPASHLKHQTSNSLPNWLCFAQAGPADGDARLTGHGKTPGLLICDL